MNVLILNCIECVDGHVVITSTLSKYGLAARTRDALAVPDLDISLALEMSNAHLRAAGAALGPLDGPEWTAWAHG